MPFFDNPAQAAEARINAGKEMQKMGNAKRVGSIPQRLSAKQALDLVKEGTKERLAGEMQLNRLRAAQSSDEGNNMPPVTALDLERIGTNESGEAIIQRTKAAQSTDESQ
ncbi:MAG: hypothetical protein ACYSVY_27600 [Planctomycetota bacterium]|jgi:hypothetical protein